MIEFSRKGKYIIEWDCFAWDYSRENEKAIIDAFSKKYNVPKSQIRVEPNVTVVDENGKEISIKSEIIDNIQDPKFQQKLFQDYINMNNIENINFEEILKFDNEVNENIDYSSYEKLSKINVKWIEFKNFLSFGSDLQRLDFTQLKDIVLVASDPVNMGGKTTLTLELLSFLLYGKTSKAKMQENIFNRFLPNETEVIVRGCVSINGNDYIIERILTRPKKRAKTNKVTGSLKYYKVIDNLWNQDEPLIEYDPDTFDNKSEDVNKTNKIIKESLMKEDDFKLISVADSKSLDAIIDTGEANLSKIFSRFLGINILEDKEVIAKNIWKVKEKELLSNRYSTDALQEDILEHKRKIETSNNIIVITKEKLVNSNKIVDSYNKDKENILSTKGQVDESLVKLDIQTQENSRNNLKQQGENLRTEQTIYTNQITELKDINVDKNIVENNRKTILGLTSEISAIKTEINTLKTTNTQLETSKVCPTCKRVYDDNTIININENIKNNTNRINWLIEQGIIKNNQKQQVENENTSLEELLKKIDERNKLELKLSQVNVNIERTLNQFFQVDQLIKNYENNREAIARNNQIDISIQNINIKINTENTLRDSYVREISQEESNIKQFTSVIVNDEQIIGKLHIEGVYIRHYKLYLNLLSKDGIKKIVLRNVLPILNSSINNLIGNLVPFNTSISIDDKNNIGFLIEKENENGEIEEGNLISASGYERTISALALRSVLSKYSTIPQLNFFCVDEVNGRVGEENFPILYELFEKIKNNYQFIFLISHSTNFNQFFEHIITIEKTHNVSKIKV